MTRLVGEKPISSIPDQRTPRKVKRLYNTYFPVNCSYCGVEFNMRYVNIKKFVKITCCECHKKNKQEMQDALISLHARKNK